MSLNVYPNPLKNNILKVKTETKFSPYSVTDMLGNEILNGNLINNSINLNSLKSVMYMVRVIEKDKIITRKFVKE